tara:strand:- start:119 stop:718 length:600 start_codon:yes stop_codon:yes gene_type:complete
MNYIIILDAGHGGLINNVYQTKGKRSPIWSDGSQYFEGVGNRQIVSKLTDKLKAKGFEVFNANDSEKDMSLRKRTALINQEIKDNKGKEYIGISIHSNGFSKESAHGWSVYSYTKASKQSKKMSKLIANKMQKEFADRRFRGEKSANFWMVKKTNCPFILTENFFMTNEKECKEILMNKKGQDKIVKLHFDFICEYLKL